MDFQGEGSPGILLVSRILIASGVVFLLSGAFVALFVNVSIGIVLVVVGVLDLATSVLLPWLTSRQGEQ